MKYIDHGGVQGNNTGESDRVETKVGSSSRKNRGREKKKGVTEKSFLRIRL